MSRSTESKSTLLSSSYIVLLSGTHVTGKETLAVSLSKALSCPWIKAEMAHAAAGFGSKSQAKRGYDYGKVFGRIWFSKLRRLGFLTDGNESDGETKVEAPRKLGTEGCTAVLTLYHMRKPDRDAIRDVMRAHSIRSIFVIMHITKETLSGRTLGAEEPALAARIMEKKMADIEKPLEEEKDVILIDSMQDVDTLYPEIMEAISLQLQINTYKA
jgi:gluconate kinase